MTLVQKLEEILLEDNLTDDTLLDNLDGYNSLNIIAIIAFIRTEYGVSLTPMDFVNIKTVAEAEERDKKFKDKKLKNFYQSKRDKTREFLNKEMERIKSKSE